MKILFHSAKAIEPAEEEWTPQSWTRELHSRAWIVLDGLMWKNHAFMHFGQHTVLWIYWRAHEGKDLDVG